MKVLLEVECLACGGIRKMAGTRLDEVGERAECGYLGPHLGSGDAESS